MTMVGWRGPRMQGVRGRQSLFDGCGLVDGVVGGVVCWLLVRGVVMVIPPSCLICLRGGDVGLLARAAGPIRFVVGPWFICLLTQRHHGAARR